ncbi:MAG: hypothetical protein ACRCYQ_05995, partial [Nocardioides sp.]
MKFNSRTTAVAGAAALIAGGLVVGTPSAGQAVSQVVTVTRTADSGVGSLRAAIEAANDPTLDVDRIEFGIRFGARPLTIAPLTDLPDITEPVTIDGYTQPGTTAATSQSGASKLIILNASLMNEGLQVSANGSTIRGLAIVNATNGGPGISINGNQNTVSGNHIGLGISGVAAGNEGSGVQVEGKANVIGGSTPAERNVISANEQEGVFLR